ncbi:MAG: serine hydrolase [Candidatus Buchananbacteria bacterium]
MKKIILTSFVILAIFSLAVPQASFAVVSGAFNASQKLAAVAKKKVVKKKVVAPPLTAKDLIGRLVLEKDSFNKLWYIEPATKERYYIRDDEDISLLISAFGKKPTKADFAKLAKNSKTKTPVALAAKYKGSIIISPLDNKTAYYFNPADNITYIINNFNDLYAAAKVIGLSASDTLFRQITMNSKQLTYDPAFTGIAYVKYDGEKYSDGSNSDRILPLASLSKVMTALVFIETNSDWNREIEITPEEIRYPCTLQACGSTSEVNLKAGDRLRVIDLWVAMLSASSNQSAAILADNSGMTRQEFIDKMNQKAKDLGLVKTHFEEMSGLSADNISTAKEYSKVAKAAFDNSWIAEATRSVDYVFTVQQADGTSRDVRVLNRNSSLLAMGPNASKSGYLVEAQRNAVIEKDGNIYIAMHCYSLGQRNSTIARMLEGSTLATAQ